MKFLILMVVLPLLAAFLQPLVSRLSEGLGRWFGPAVLAGSIVMALQLWLEAGQLPQAFALGGFMAPMGITFYVDGMALLFALATLLMGLLLWPAFSQREADVKEYALTLLMLGAGSGLAFSGDLFNIYVFYELISVASFGLAAVKRTPAAFAASLRYVIISSVGTVLALTGIAIIYTQTGSLNLAHLSQLAPEMLNNPQGLAAFILILVGVGVKAELFPVNSWVPDVYATTTARVTGLLAGLVSKLAVLVIVRLMLLVFPLDMASQWMLWLGIAGVLTGELAAYRSQDLRRALSFSSIAQLGVIFIAFSFSVQIGLLAGLVLSLHHMIVKPALFLLAEQWGNLSSLKGGFARSPWLSMVFIVLALSLIGVPPLPGFWAKFLLFIGLAESGTFAHWLALAVVLNSVVIEAGYLFRWGMQLFQTPDDSDSGLVLHADSRSFFITLALITVLLGSLLMLPSLTDWLSQIADQAGNSALYVRTVLGS